MAHEDGAHAGQLAQTGEYGAGGEAQGADLRGPGIGLVTGKVVAIPA